MSKILYAAERFRQDYAPNKTAGETTAWYCVDDRYALVDGLYRQTAGGAIGVGQDVKAAIAMSAQRRNALSLDHAEQGTRSNYPVQIMGGIAAKILLSENIVLGLHKGCAAENGVQAIAEIEATGSEELYNRAETIKPGLTASQFEQYVGIKRDILAAGGIISPQEAATYLENGKAWRQDSNPVELNPVPRVTLVESPHVSPIMIADYGENIAYDVRGAFTHPTESLPAYHISMGDMPPDIAEPLSDVFGFKVEDFMAATAIRHAATSIALDPHAPEGHDEIQIYHVA